MIIASGTSSRHLQALSEILVTQLKRLGIDDCRIEGKDSKRFLNGITTGNIVELNNRILKTCWLSPNGVLKSLLEINCSENQLEVIVFVGNTSEIRNYFNDIIFPSDDVSLSETFSVNRIQEVDDINSLADLASETIIDGDIASLAKLEKLLALESLNFLQFL